MDFTMPSRRVDLLDALLADFAPETARVYRADLFDFAAFLDRKHPNAAAKMLFDCTRQQARDCLDLYHEELQGRDLAESTVTRRLTSVRALLRLGRTFGLITWTL